jgi:hypothetical protein
MRMRSVVWPFFEYAPLADLNWPHSVFKLTGGRFGSGKLIPILSAAQSAPQTVIILGHADALAKAACCSRRHTGSSSACGGGPTGPVSSTVSQLPRPGGGPPLGGRTKPGPSSGTPPTAAGRDHLQFGSIMDKQIEIWLFVPRIQVVDAASWQPQFDEWQTQLHTPRRGLSIS